MWEEFKKFAIKGNAMALAVGPIIGAAFNNITKSLTNDIIMPIVNIFMGGADFTGAKIALPRMPWIAPKYETVVGENGEEIMREVRNYLTYGSFLTAVINFFILAFVVFFIVKFLNHLSDLVKREEEEVPEKPAEPAPEPAPAPAAEASEVSKQEIVLLTEIRDLLQER